MTKQVICRFNGISEHDIDMALLQLFSTDEVFVEFVCAHVGVNTDKVLVEAIELSKTDSDLGESDIEVSLLANGKRILLMIEDKVDAIAMPRQPERYVERGENAVKRGKCDEYITLLVCPQKYYENDDAAKKYKYHLFYETSREFLSTKAEPIFRVYYQLFADAITRSKRPPKVVINPKANSFFRKYSEYQKEKYPYLDLRTKPDANGYWAQYATTLKNVYLHHKIQEGRVDLTFNKASEKTNDLQQIAEWLRSHSMKSVKALAIAKSGALEITVPKLDMNNPFEDADFEDVQICFEAISELVKFANMVALSNTIGEK